MITSENEIKNSAGTGNDWGDASGLAGRGASKDLEDEKEKPGRASLDEGIAVAKPTI